MPNPKVVSGVVPHWSPGESLGAGQGLRSKSPRSLARKLLRASQLGF